MVKRTKTPPVEPLTLERAKNLTLAQLAEVLSSESDEPITVEEIQAHIEAGCPVNPDGTMNLLAYGAWLTREERGG
jgi:hypothetical protein